MDVRHYIGVFAMINFYVAGFYRHILIYGYRVTRRWENEFEIGFSLVNGYAPYASFIETSLSK